MNIEAQLKDLQAELPDIQNLEDTRKIPIDFVGIDNLFYPMYISSNGTKQKIVAELAFQADLKKDYKGISMSKFIDVLHAKNQSLNLNYDGVNSIVDTARDKLESDSVLFTADFKYFMEKNAPISKYPSYLSHEIKIIAIHEDNITNQFISLSVPVQSACPSSVMLAETNSHNQRSIINVKLRYDGDFKIDDTISLIESMGSTEVFSSIKRIDEQHIVRESIKNPKFVEDIVRDITMELEKNKMLWYEVSSCHYESIHNHQAYAKIYNHDELKKLSLKCLREL